MASVWRLGVQVQRSGGDEGLRAGIQNERLGSYSKISGGYMNKKVVMWAAVVALVSAPVLELEGAGGPRGRRGSRDDGRQLTAVLKSCPAWARAVVRRAPA